MDKDKIAESEVQQKLVVKEPGLNTESVSDRAPSLTDEEKSEATRAALESNQLDESLLQPDRTDTNQSARFDGSSNKKEPALIRVKDLKSRRKEQKDGPPASVKRTRTMYVTIALLTTVIGLVTVPVAWVTWTVLSYAYPHSPGIRFFTQPKQVGETKDPIRHLREEQQWRAKMRSMSKQIKDMPKPAATQFATGYSDPNFEADALSLLKSKKFRELNKMIEKASTTERVQFRNGSERLDDLYRVLADPGEVPDAAWKERLALLQEWAASENKSAIPHVVLADFYIKYAWNARGSGWAKDVQDWQWDLFRERLYLSTNQLQMALDVGTPTPEWFSVAQINILGAGKKADVPLFDAITETGNLFYPNYYPLYLHEVYYLQPRWYGNNSQWVDYATKAADAVGGDEGDKLYARMVAKVANMYRNLYQDNPTLSEDRLHRGNALLDKQFGSSR